MGTRMVTAVALGVALTVPAGLWSPSAGATAHEAAVTSTGHVIAGGGVLRWTVDAGAEPGLRWIRRSEPCLTVTSVADARTGRICVVSPRRAQVTRGDGTDFRAPVRTRWDSRLLTISMRQADTGFAPGRYDASTECADASCGAASSQVTLPILRVESCQAMAPWLVHGGDPDVGRAVALTFDDGPGATTARVARILQRFSVLGTFFQLGRMVEAASDQTETLARRGHVVGNHSYSHSVLSGTERSELARTNRVIRRAGAPQPCVFRAPYGENPPTLVALAKDLGMTTVHWNTDPGDWRGLGTDEIVRTTLAQVRPGSILVFHDAEAGHEMVRALPRILEHLQVRGYRFLTVPELLRLPVTYR